MKANRFTMSIKRNTPTILSFIAIIGVVGTGIVSGVTAAKVEKEERVLNRRSDKKEYVKRYWKNYIPAIGVGILTCSCIGMSDSMNRKRQAALMSACLVSAETFKKYKETVNEMYGENSDISIRNEMAKKNMPEDIDAPEDGELLFYDEYSERYFNATMDEVKSAEYHFNRNFILRGYAELNEFYDFLGLEHIDDGSALGWSTWAESTYGYKWVDFSHEKVVMDDGLECYILRYEFEPHADYLEC